MTEVQKRDARERGRKWYRANRERRLARCRQYNLENKDVIRVRLKRYADAHREQRNAASRKRHALNPKPRRESRRNWYARNIESEKERNRTRARLRFKQNREAVLAYNRRWAKEHPEVINAKSIKRRALMNGARINLVHIKEWMASVKAKPFTRCYWCENRVSTKRIHFDHIVPLKKGGEHSVSNLCVSCIGCNTSKKDKEITAWVRIGQQTLAL